jgi:hypothetical protein
MIGSWTHDLHRIQTTTKMPVVQRSVMISEYIYSSDIFASLPITVVYKRIPEGRAKDSKKAAKANIEQLQPEPLEKQDPIDPVKVRSNETKRTILININTPRSFLFVCIPYFLVFLCTY